MREGSPLGLGGSDDDPELRITGYLVFSERIGFAAWLAGWTLRSLPFAPKIVAKIPSSLWVEFGLCRKALVYRRGGARWCRSHRVRTGLRHRESGIRKKPLWERWHNSDKRSRRKRKRRCCHRLLGRLGPLASSRSIGLQAESPNGDRSCPLLEKRQPPSREGSSGK